ncbi:MAG TPA: SDR family oxidoreductase [Geminicoccaceae bacterium]|nr:SDR family oxidoreductase [Geminicoccaceae bacterium]
MPNDPFDLGGRVALVTGSSRGLGLAMARGLGRAGALLVLNGRDYAALDRTAAVLAGEGLGVHALAFDVTDRAAVEAAVDDIEGRIGPIGILVNNAGIQRRAPLEEMEEAVWREVIEVNLTSAFIVGQAVGRRMIARRRGKIINICSLTSEVTRPSIAPYTAAKGGLKMLTKSMAVEWARHNVQVNGIGPGYFATELNTALIDNPEFDAWVRARTPAGRWAEPEELAGTAVFLASAASDFVTGQVIYVDGGLLSTM